MDWQALGLSLKLAAMTTILLLPLAIMLARWLAWSQFAWKGFVEALVALPLVLPPTVLGYYLLILFSRQGLIGAPYAALFDTSLAFSFTGLLLASFLFNLPFAVQPAQRAFETVSREVRESAWCCGMTPWQTFWRVELPLAWGGVLSSLLLTFAHTLGEFGVILMVGGNIPGQTRTLSIAIFDQVEAFNEQAAANMSLLLLGFSITVIGCVYFLNHRLRRAENA
ncbi:MAG: molybdate transport system permease protein [Parasphingorhabdus sp.]|jgi:molybdate transport system permease protein